MSIFNQDELTLPKPNYEYITTEKHALEALKEINYYDIIEVDTETTGLDPFKDKIALLQLGVDNRAYVFDVRGDTGHSEIDLYIFKDLLTDRSKLKLLQNAVYDMKMIKASAGYYIENIYDTMITEQLFNLGIKMRGFGLGDLVFKYTGLKMDKEVHNTFRDYDQVFKPYQLEYAASDVVVLGLIREMQLPMIKHHGFEDVCQLEFDFVKPMCEMELNGISMDVDKWRIMLEEMEVDRQEQLAVINTKFIKQSNQTTLFGVSMVNIDSPSQLKESLKDFGLDLTSTSVEALKKYTGLDIIDSILRYRKTQKFLSTYGESLIERINPVTGRLHTSFRQMVSTGRMSSSRPNMQNIPAKQKFRSCFVAGEGKALITADMSGAELRILGNLSQDPIFIHCYSNGIDIHTKTASEIYKVSMEEAAKSVYRKPAKAVGFGICVADSTNMITSGGIKEIKDVVVGINTAHDVGENKIIDHKYMGKKECYRVTTRYGYLLECTQDHIVKVIDVEGNYIDKKVSELDIDNDSVCIKYGSNVFSKTIPQFAGVSITKRTNSMSFDLPQYLDDLWAAFLGLFVSEGSLHKGRQGRYDGVSFGFSTKEPDLLTAVDVLFESLFGTKHKCRIDNDIKTYALHSVHFAKWLANILNVEYGDNKTNTIHVPVCIKQSPKNVQTMFMRWLWEGDGTVWLKGKRSSISYSSRSSSLVHGLQIMLLNIGILSAVNKCNDKRYPDNDYYKLEIVGNYSKNLFMKDIGFVTNHKNNKYVAGEGVTIKSVYSIPNQKVRLEKLKVRVLNGDVDISNWYTDGLNKITTDKKHYIKNVLNNAMAPGRGLGNAHLKHAGNGDRFIKFIYDNNIVPLPIKSIEKVGTKKVYDVSVEDHQYFLANGIVTHNCYGMSKYGLAARLSISEMEADKIIKGYLNTYSKVSEFLTRSGKEAVVNSYSRSISNRKRFYTLPPSYSPDRKNIERAVERQAKNAPVQSSNADTIKQSMIYCVERLEKLDYSAKLLLTVHDEVVAETDWEHRYEVAKIVSQSLIDGFAKYFSTIPMEADALIGTCWLKGACENDVNGVECGGAEMEFVPDEKYGTKLICKKCGADM